MNNRCVIANGFGPTHLPPFPFNFKHFHGLIPAIAVSGFGSSGQGKLLERSSSSSSLRLKFVVSAELSKQFSSIGLDSHVCIIGPIPNVPFVRQFFFSLIILYLRNGLVSSGNCFTNLSHLVLLVVLFIYWGVGVGFYFCSGLRFESFQYFSICFLSVVGVFWSEPFHSNLGVVKTPPEG